MMARRRDRIVVTGGAGFIGSHLVDVLLSRDNEVVVIDDLSSGSRANIAHHAGTSLTLEQVSVLDEQVMLELMKGARFVYHLATRNVRLSLRRPTEVHDVNTTGTLNVLKAAAAAKVERLLYCSSSEVNGTAHIVPMAEDYLFRPETIYGASKLAGEYYAQVFHKSRWLDVVIARPHNNYGPREHYRGVMGEVIPRFIVWALAGRPLVVFGDGAQTRDFTYVTETAELMVQLMGCREAAGEVYNICRGEEVSIRRIAELVSSLVGGPSKAEYRAGRPNDVLRLYGDPAKLKKALGTSPQIGIEDGLARTVAWFREHVPVTEEVLASLQPANWQQAAREPWMGARAADTGPGARRSGD